MTRHDPTIPAPASDSGPPEQHCSQLEAPLPGREGQADDDNWDEGPPRRRQRSECEREEDPEYFDHYAIGERHLRLIEKLIERTHPLATEYLTTAQAVSPDAPGRERVVNLGCRLVTSTHQLISVSARLRDVD